MGGHLGPKNWEMCPVKISMGILRRLYWRGYPNKRTNAADGLAKMQYVNMRFAQPLRQMQVTGIIMQAKWPSDCLWGVHVWVWWSVVPEGGDKWRGLVGARCFAKVLMAALGVAHQTGTGHAPSPSSTAAPSPRLNPGPESGGAHPRTDRAKPHRTTLRCDFPPNPPLAPAGPPAALHEASDGQRLAPAAQDPGGCRDSFSSSVRRAHSGSCS